MRRLARREDRGRGTRPIASGATATFALAFALSIPGMSAPARAGLVINATFDPTITNDPNAAAIEDTINQAINFYQSNITTSITVNLKFDSMTSGLGRSSTFINTVSYSDFRSALQSQANSAADNSALASLPAGPNNPVDGGANLYLTTANLRALGFTSEGTLSPGQFDSTISLNTGITNYGGSSNPNNYSLLAVTEHEIDEALGLGSSLGSSLTSPRAEDLFRYSAHGVRSYTTSTSATAYFSIDGGSTSILGFNQSGSGDYGDWVSSTTPHVQDAFGTPGANESLTPTSPEVTALDVIGYNFAPTPPTPEPPSLALVSIALTLVGLRSWRRKAGPA